jgi:hypothetical protein
MDAREAFFLDSRNDVAVDQQRGGAVMIEGDTENARHDVMTAPQLWSGERIQYSG